MGLISWWFFDLDIQREEKNVQKAIKEAAKRNDMGSAKVLWFKNFIRTLMNDSMLLFFFSNPAIFIAIWQDSFLWEFISNFNIQIKFLILAALKKRYCDYYIL